MDAGLRTVTTTPVPLFAYGTLRPGEALEGWLARAVHHHEPGTLVGHDLLAPPGGSYPYLVASRLRDAVVHGDVLYVDPTAEAFADTVVMELNAGYVIKAVPVTLASGRREKALTFLCLDPSPRWRRIPSGDWTARS